MAVRERERRRQRFGLVATVRRSNIIDAKPTFRLTVVFLFLCGASLTTLLLVKRAAGSDRGLSLGQRDAAESCIRQVASEVQDRYYDPTLHGIDLKQRTTEAIERADKVHTLSEVYGIIAWMLEPLNDSHTFFIPPARPYNVQHGWEYEFIGDKPYITAVKPDSDAFAQGVRPGDELLTLEGFNVSRENSWKLQYAFEGLAPRSAMHLTVRDPEGKTRTILANAHVEKLPNAVDILGPEEWFQMKGIRHLTESRIVEMGDDVMIWKLASFQFDDIDKNIRSAQKHRALILDLRGNPGGDESILSKMISRFFSREVIVGERVQRNHTRDWKVESKSPEKIFTGKLVILIDSQTASAAEIFARVIQIEGRGVVVGDRSSGMVMGAVHTHFVAGTSPPIPAAVSVTEEDLHMRDGKSLEHLGVEPDRTVLPLPQDLVSGRDPALAASAEELGTNLTPEQAGKLFPAVWRNF